MEIGRIHNYVRVDKLGGGTHPGYLEYIRYNFLMAWAIITIYTSKCMQMDPQQLPKTSHFIPDAKSEICQHP